MAKFVHGFREPFEEVEVDAEDVTALIMAGPERTVVMRKRGDEETALMIHHSISDAMEALTGIKLHFGCGGPPIFGPMEA